MISDELDLPLPPDHKAGFVAVIGAPNAGKSTLMNAILGQKIAIVSHRPQTTRARQLGILTTESHQIIFVDTPGLIRHAMHKLDETMIETVKQTVEGADLILWLVDMSIKPTSSDLAVGELLQAISADIPVVLGLNKLDLLKAHQVIPQMEAFRALLPSATWLAFSAETKAGLPQLQQLLLDALPTGPRFYPADQVTETFVRTISAEMVREQLLRQLADEVPHTVAVAVDEFKERENGVTYIHATIYVERDSQKKIIIGRNGAQIKRIGMEARKEIERLTETPVFLELFVKIAPKWREDPRFIEQFGYTAPKG